jgi:hypothetical protein
MVITNQPPPVGLWPSHRPATHHPLHQQPSDQTVTEVTDPTDHVTANDLTWKIEDYHHVPALGQQTYSVMCVHFATLNADNGFHQAFTDKPFPTYEVTAAFVQAYFEHFQPLFPIIHQPNFNPRETPWILTLAVAVIGSRYSVLGVDSSVLHLHEFLRRSINLWVSLNLLHNLHHTIARKVSLQCLQERTRLCIRSVVSSMPCSSHGPQSNWDDVFWQHGDG